MRYKYGDDTCGYNVLLKACITEIIYYIFGNIIQK